MIESIQSIEEHTTLDEVCESSILRPTITASVLDRSKCLRGKSVTAMPPCSSCKLIAEVIEMRIAIWHFLAVSVTLELDIEPHHIVAVLFINAGDSRRQQPIGRHVHRPSS